MLIMTKPASNLAIGYHPRLRVGPRVQPRPLNADTSGIFPGLFLRPDPASNGTVPVPTNLSLCSSPDIWCAGSTPVANFQTALATTNSYATASADNVLEGVPNYIYVRANNSTTQVQSTQVQLYGLPSGVLQWPSQWSDWAIPTDITSSPVPLVYASTLSASANAIGVAQNTFVWQNPGAPPVGSDHYCFIAWLNNGNNPFPNVLSQLDLAGLVTNNLGFGWRNTVFVSGSQPTIQMTTQLSIPSDISGGNAYSLVITPGGFPAGWELSMSCSETDSNGNNIAISQQPLPAAGQFFGVSVTLNPGYNAVITFNLFQNGAAASAGASLTAALQYLAPPSELDRALREGLVDFALSRALHKAFRCDGIPIQPVICLGQDGLQTV